MSVSFSLLFAICGPVRTALNVSIYHPVIT
jgi:hypothetical protein